MCDQLYGSISAGDQLGEPQMTNAGNHLSRDGEPSNVFIGEFQGPGDEMNNVTQVNVLL